jgi:hypothetical protein
LAERRNEKRWGSAPRVLRRWRRGSRDSRGIPRWILLLRLRGLVLGASGERGLVVGFSKFGVGRRDEGGTLASSGGKRKGRPPSKENGEEKRSE